MWPAQDLRFSGAPGARADLNGGSLYNPRIKCVIKISSNIFGVVFRNSRHTVHDCTCHKLASVCVEEARKDQR